jgi:hypothetical protein
MHQRQLGVSAFAKGEGALDDRIAFFSEVNGDQNVFVVHGRALQRIAIR